MYHWNGHSSPSQPEKFFGRSRIRVDLIDTGVAYILLDTRVDKGNALVQLARLAKLSLADSTGIGDNFNDLSLFREVAHKIAVANAPEEVKRQADYVCEHAYGRGFLEAVAHVGL